jgi:site-specific recombinase XerD
METGLVISNELASIPGIHEGLIRAQRVWDSIRNFDDIERVFLKGAGLAASTYRSYIGSIRDFYVWSEHKHPLTVVPSDIEEWYDDMSKRVGRNTACLRVFGLKRFFRGIQSLLPFFTSPFEMMEVRLLKKLSRAKNGNRTLPGLTSEELRDILAWLGGLGTLRARQDRAMMFFLATSGLRAIEFCQLTHGSIQRIGDIVSAKFIGKGNKDAEQELHKPAIDAAVSVFKEQFGREPAPTDALFYTLPYEHTRKPAPMNYPVLYERVRLVGVAARAAGIVKRDMAWSPHMLRRTYTTILYKAGMGLKAISNKTRHVNISGLQEYIVDEEQAAPYLDKVFNV